MSKGKIWGRYLWRQPISAWSFEVRKAYLDWVLATYGDQKPEDAFNFVEQYRAVKEVEASVEPEIPSMTEALAKSLQDTKDRMAANLLTKLWDNYEQEQDNKTEASKIPAKKVALEKQRKIL